MPYLETQHPHPPVLLVDTACLSKIHLELQLTTYCNIASHEIGVASLPLKLPLDLATQAENILHQRSSGELVQFWPRNLAALARETKSMRGSALNDLGAALEGSEVFFA